MKNSSVSSETFKNPIGIKGFFIFTTIGAIILSFIPLYRISFSYNGNVIGILAFCNSLIILITGIATLFRFYTERIKRDLILGIGLVSLFVIEFYYSLLLSGLLSAFSSHPVSDIYWASLVSMLYLQGVIIFALRYRNLKVHKLKIKNERKLYLFIPASAVFFLFLIILFPSSFFSGNISILMGLPVMIFTGLVIFLVKSESWKKDIFEFCFLFALIVFLLGQALFLFTSGTPYDVQFLISQILKGVGYSSILFGLTTYFYNQLKNFHLQKRQLYRETIKLSFLQMKIF